MKNSTISSWHEIEVKPSGGFAGSIDIAFSWLRLPNEPFYQGTPLSTPSTIPQAIPRIFGIGFTGVIDWNYSSITLSVEDLIQRPALSISDNIVSIMLQY